MRDDQPVWVSVRNGTADRILAHLDPDCSKQRATPPSRVPTIWAAAAAIPGCVLCGGCAARIHNAKKVSGLDPMLIGPSGG